ncbi:MAG TPA: hypothetical protein VFS40_09375 [Gemmatimonadales bacterium]|nr:hypothetical protein [Gemmatimonadales bacterium]
MKRGLLFAMGLASAFAMTSTAQAQTAAPLRQGFFLSAGLGAGSAGLTTSSAGVSTSSDREFGPVASIRLGLAVSPSLILSIESTAWTKSYEDTDLGNGRATLGVAGINAAFYPTPKAPVFVKLGVGGGLTQFKPDASGTKVESFGLGGTVGVGYDVRVGGIFLTPFVDYVKAFNATAKVDGSKTDAKLGSNTIQGGVAITLY